MQMISVGGGFEAKDVKPEASGKEMDQMMMELIGNTVSGQKFMDMGQVFEASEKVKNVHWKKIEMGKVKSTGPDLFSEKLDHRLYEKVDIVGTCAVDDTMQSRVDLTYEPCTTFKVEFNDKHIAESVVGSVYMGCICTVMANSDDEENVEFIVASFPKHRYMADGVVTAMVQVISVSDDDTPDDYVPNVFTLPDGADDQNIIIELNYRIRELSHRILRFNGGTQQLRDGAVEALRILMMRDRRDAGKFGKAMMEGNEEGVEDAKMFG